MARPSALSAEQVAAALAELPEWSGDGTGIERTVKQSSFPAAVDAIVQIAAVAEELDHHPDLDLRWRTVRVSVVTHSAGGVTELDLELARRVDELFAPLEDANPELARMVDSWFTRKRASAGDGSTAPEDDGSPA